MNRIRRFYFTYGRLILVLLAAIGSLLLCLRLTSMNRAHNISYRQAIITYDSQPSGCAPFASDVTAKKLFQDYYKILEDPAWIKKSTLHSISYQQLHALLFGANTVNLYETWPNHFKKQFDGTYPHTSLTQPLFAALLNETELPIHLVVEVGSFMGKSATNIGLTLRNDKRWSSALLVCIDTWLGGLEHWTLDDLRELMHVENGRPTVYEQFVANIIANNLTRSVLPFSTTSIIGARFLLVKKIFPQIVYLDSAHLQGETYLELELYWTLLQSGGILIGDDWGWPSVRCDVLRFCSTQKVNVNVIDNTWYIKKTQ